MHNFTGRLAKISFSIIATLVLFSCRKEITTSEPIPCSPVHLDSIYRTDNWRQAAVYQQNNEFVRFTNQNGDSMIMELSYQFDAEIEERSFYRLCDFSDQADQLCYVNGWHHHRTYRDVSGVNEFNLDYHMAPVYSWQDSLVWYEIMEVSASLQIEDYILASIIPIVIDENNADPYARGIFIEPVDELTLSGQTFYDVYISEDHGLYYSHEQGIIAWLDEFDNLWLINP